MVKITTYLDMVPCCLVTTHQYCKVTFRDDVSTCRLSRLFDHRIHIVFDDGIEQSAEISSYVSNLAWITSRDEFLKYSVVKCFNIT